MACGAFSFARREGGGVAGKAWGILYILERFVFPAIALSTPFYTPQLSGGGIVLHFSVCIVPYICPLP